MPGHYEAETFYLKGGLTTLAITKQKKSELVTQYVDCINSSKAIILTEYKGLTVKDLDQLRKQAREVGGEFHIVKNTLSEIAFEKAGLEAPENIFVGTTAIAYAYDDAPGMAKIISELSKESEFVNIKCGYLEKQLLTPSEVTALADIPPLPVLRAKLLGTLMAPARKLAGTIAEPARQVVAVMNAYAESGQAQSSA